ELELRDFEGFHPGDAEGGVAHPYRGFAGTRVDVRARRAQRGRPAIRLRGRGAPGLRLRRSPVLPEPLLRRHAGAPTGAGFLRSDLGLPAKSCGPERAPRGDILRSAGPHRQRSAFRDGDHGHTPRPGRRRTAALHATDNVFPAASQRGGSNGDPAGFAAVQGLDRRRRARLLRGGASAGGLRGSVRQGAGAWSADGRPRRRRRAARVHLAGPRRPRGVAHRPRSSLRGGSEARREAERRSSAPDRVPALQRRFARLRFHRGSQPEADVGSRSVRDGKLRRPGVLRRLRKRKLRGRAERASHVPGRRLPVGGELVPGLVPRCRGKTTVAGRAGRLLRFAPL
ncbi:MAG: Adenosine deaminase, partial [uncultured Rubrobacteraceae bacterium]